MGDLSDVGRERLYSRKATSVERRLFEKLERLREYAETLENMGPVGPEDSLFIRGHIEASRDIGRNIREMLDG